MRLPIPHSIVRYMRQTGAAACPWIAGVLFSLALASPGMNLGRFVQGPDSRDLPRQVVLLSRCCDTLRHPSGRCERGR